MPANRPTPTYRRPLFLAAVFSLVLASLFAVLVTSLAPAHGSPLPAAALRQEDVAADEPALEYAPGVVLVKLKAGAALPTQSGLAAAQAMGTDAAVVAGLFQSYGVTAAEALFPAAGAPAGYTAQAAPGAEGALSRVYRLHLAPQLDAGQIAVALAADANVEYAEPDYIARGLASPTTRSMGRSGRWERSVRRGPGICRRAAPAW